MEETTDSVTKAILAESISGGSSSVSLKKANEIVETILHGIKDTLVKNEEVKISGFGKFVPHDKKSRVGRNPKTGEPITIADRRVVKFKVSDCLKAELNGDPFDGVD